MRDKRNIPAALLTIAVFAVFIICAVMLSTPEDRAEILITEVLSSNRGIVFDEDGSSPDFIELYNAGRADVNLLGWYLSDNSNAPMKWVIPSITLKPGEYVYFFASGKDKQQADGIWHTNFKVAADGSEQVLLTMPDGTAHTRIAPFETLENTSYGLADDFETYAYMSIPTPGSANVAPFYSDLQSVPQDRKALVITEYMTQNDSFFPDGDGLFHDWAEIYNPGDDEVSLKGWYLSDNPDRPTKWGFPDDAVIAPRGYLVLHCSGLDLPGHAGFRLSGNDEALVLSDYNGVVVDWIVVVETPLHASYGRVLDGGVVAGEGFFDTPTPGAENIGEPVSSIWDLAWQKPTVLIMEYMSNNRRFMDDEDGEFSDWAELYNYGGETVDLSGMFMSDKADNLTKWRFPSGSRLAPGERAIVWLSGKNRAQPLHASFSLSDSDDGLFLSDKYGRLIDEADIVSLPTDVSYGRDEENYARWLFFASPTPNAPNNTRGFGELPSGVAGYSSYAMRVQADVDYLIVQEGTAVTLSAGEPEAAIYYTLDGRVPTESSLKYSAPIVISESTVLRARAFAPGKQPGEVMSRTYLVGVTHEVPVVALATDPDNLFSDSMGIYANGPGWIAPGEEGWSIYNAAANYWKDWERDVHFAFYEDGLLGVETDAGVRIHGQMSREYPQKSLAVFFRSKYGMPRITYPLVPGIERMTYDALILRSGGQDIYGAKLRDAVTHTAVLDATNVTAMGAQPVAVYINGRYWGLHHLHEKINEDYFEINAGIANDEIDIVKTGKTALAGSRQGYLNMLGRLGSMNMNTDEAYAYADDNIDIDNWIDYWVIVTYFGNTATHNIKCYREHGEEGRWRWILFDQDHAMRQNGFNSLANMLNPEGHGGFHGEYYITDNTIERALLRNDAIRMRFLERYAELLDTVLAADRLLRILDDYAAVMSPEMPRQIARWGFPSSMEAWEDDLEQIRRFIRGRDETIKRYIRSAFNLTDAEMAAIFGE